MAIYFGFAVADSMFPAECEVHRRPLTPEDARAIAARPDTVCVANPSHAATIAAARDRFGLTLDLPAEPPVVALRHGDALVVMSVRGLPRLTDRRDYTAEEVAAATFAFGLWVCADASRLARDRAALLNAAARLLNAERHCLQTAGDGDDREAAGLREYEQAVGHLAAAVDAALAG